MAILGCTTEYLILPHWDSRGDRSYLAPGRGRLAFPSEKMVPNLSRTVCIEKLTESVSIMGLSLSGMVGVSWHIFAGVSWNIYIQPPVEKSLYSRIPLIEIIRIFNGCEVLIENSVTRVTAERCRAVTRVTEFSFCTEEPLWILFLAYSSFDNCI